MQLLFCYVSHIIELYACLLLYIFASLSYIHICIYMNLYFNIALRRKDAQHNHRRIISSNVDLSLVFVVAIERRPDFFFDICTFIITINIVTSWLIVYFVSTTKSDKLHNCASVERPSNMSNKDVTGGGPQLVPCSVMLKLRGLVKLW